MPEPKRVAAFLDTYRLDLEQAGSRERPYSRGQGDDFPALLQRLSAYVPPRKSAEYLARWQFSAARDKAYTQRVSDALTPRGNDSVVEVPLHARELDALLQLLTYAQVSPEALRPRDFAHLLASDIEGLRGGGSEAAARYRSALAKAAPRRQRRDERRRGQKGGEG
ncbi:hypothetical protein QA811_41975 [Streptomyces sp. B21-102]|uniref:hypothetical protein n=1 Tax=Streptomyces sp. B21-102 TaxID=3039416 RepID=UPI002FF3607F